MAETIKTKVQLKRLLLVLLTFAMLVTVTAFAACAVDVVDLGTCGDNLTWSLDSDGVLAISGTGEMGSWNDYNETAPWYSKIASIKSVIIGNGVTNIGDYAFYECEALTNVTIPNTVTTIGDYAFSNCYALKNVTIPNSVTAIGEYAFYFCKALTSVTIPDSVITIGISAFSKCYALTNVTIPNSVTTIGGNAFFYCEALTSVTIPNSVTSIGGYAFSGTALYKDNSNWTGDCLYIGKYMIKANESISGAYSIADGTKCIADDAFSHCYTLTSITIPNSVTAIGESAFSNCEALKSITIPDSVTTIGEGAFSSCTALTNVTVPNSVTTIVGCTFSYCTALKSITIPNRVTAIGDSAFSGCGALTSITIPDSVTAIGDYAFSYCDALTSITIPYSVTAIGDGAFSNCYALKSITISDSVTTIGEYAFSSCTALTSITIPNSVTAIGDGAFYGCEALTSVTIPNSVTTIGGGTFSSCNALTSITIPNSVTAIGDSAFSYCNALTSITIPDRVTAIGDDAFFNCNALTSIKIPNSVASIGMDAFFGCSGIKDVHYQGDNSNWRNIYFANAYSNPCYYGASLYCNGKLFATVTGLKVATYSTTYLKLTWTKLSGVTGYRVFKYNPTTKKYESYKNSSSNSLTVTGLKAGTQYYFKVRAYKITSGKVYWGDYSSYLKTATIPSTVTGLKVASYGNTALKLTWTNISGVTGYKVYKYNPTTKKYESYKNSTSNSLTVTGLQAGTQYYFKVRAYKSISGRNYWGNYSSFLKTATRPLNAKISSVSSPSSGRLTAKWGKVSGATGYYVQYSTNSRFSGAKAKYVNTNYINLTGLTGGTTYYVRVRPYVQIGSARIYSPNLSAYKYVRIR